jgi:chromosomal replication initiation ATPase DnaA
MSRATRQIFGDEMVTAAEPSAAVLAPPPVFCNIQPADLGKCVLADADIGALLARLLALAQHVLRDRITVRHVVEMTAEHFGTTAVDLISGCQDQLLCRHRHIAMFIARNVTRESLPSIGRCIGGRDHTTILYGTRAMQRLIDSGDTGTLAAVVRIIERLTAEAQGREVLAAAESSIALPALPMFCQPADLGKSVLADQDIDTLRNRLLALLRQTSPNRVTVRRVIEVTAEHFGTTVDDLTGGSMTKSLCRHRQIAMFVARKVTRRTLPVIGRCIGDRHQRTIRQGTQAVQRLIDAGDTGTASALVQIIERLAGQAC